MTRLYKGERTCTHSMNNFEKALKGHAYNEEKMLKELYARAEKDGLRSRWAKSPKEPFMKRKWIGWMALAAVVVISLLVADPGQWFADRSKIAVATVTVDMNPSFALSVNEDCDVIEVTALNADAETVDTSSLIGLPVGKAVNTLVELTTEAGFINLTDLEDDFVVVTKIYDDGTSEEIMDRLETQLRDQIHDGSALSQTNVVELKATQVQKMEADGKKIPAGLYVLQGMVNLPDGSVVSAKEFFADPQHLEQIRTNAQVRFTQMSETQLKARIEAALGQLESQGKDPTELRTRLENAGTDEMNQIQAEVREQLNAPEPSGNPDSGNPDSGKTDSGKTDSGKTDSGSPTDAGQNGSTNGSGGAQGSGQKGS